MKRSTNRRSKPRVIRIRSNRTHNQQIHPSQTKDSNPSQQSRMKNNDSSTEKSLSFNQINPHSVMNSAFLSQRTPVDTADKTKLSTSSHQQRNNPSWLGSTPSKTIPIIFDQKILSAGEHSTVFQQMKPPNKRKKRDQKKKFPFPSSHRCCLLSILAVFLLAVSATAITLGVLRRSTKSTTTTSVTLTTCTSLCPDETWSFSSNLLARWTFDNTFADSLNNFNATTINGASIASSGYINQALSLSSSQSQSVVIPYISLASTSFTIEAWLKPTAFPNVLDQSILGLCPSLSSGQCLYLLIRKNSSNNYLNFGFYGDDCSGQISLVVNQWVHAAFVFDISSQTKFIYVDGQLDTSCSTSSAFLATQGNITVGTIPAMIPTNNLNFYQGLIDHLSITNRAKSSCEILEDASLTACFLFDDPDPYTDSGPNNIPTRQNSTSVISSGQSAEAISFNGTSFVQGSSFTALGISNKSFSLALWVRPRVLSGTLVHVSALNTGGAGWCMPFIGLTVNGSVAVAIYSGALAILFGPSIPVTPEWSYLVSTWSVANGLRLYINSTLAASASSFQSYFASGVSDYVTLANSLNGIGYCVGIGANEIAPTAFDGDIDSFKVYSRELTASEITRLYQS